MAGKYAWTADQGSTWTTQLTVAVSGVALNLTGYSARMQLRASTDAAEPVLDLDDTAGLILGGAAGTITLDVDATTTAALAAGNYVYDLEIESGGGIVTRLLQGNFTITPEVTR